MGGASPTIVVQLTDPHICAPGQLLAGQVDTAAYLQATVEHIASSTPSPALVVATGDLTDDGSRDAYQHLAKLLDPLDAAVALLPGNHDDTANLGEVFGRPAGLASDDVGWQYVVDAGPLRVVVLETRIPGAPAGRLGPQRLAWLDFVLGESDAPTIIALHHPPYATGIDHMDAMGLEDRAALGDVIERWPQVVRLISGHLHRPITGDLRGVVATTCPGTAHQVALDLVEGDAHWVLEPPAVQLHVWLPEQQSLVTHTSYVGDYGGHHPFH